jgi:ubiquitin C-terminal hydrolase
MPTILREFIQSVNLSTGGEKTRQQDAMEFLTFLLDKLHEESNALNTTSESSNSTEKTDKTTPQSNDKSKENEDIE